jgi:hypothetical protein
MGLLGTATESAGLERKGLREKLAVDRWIPLNVHVDVGKWWLNDQNAQRPVEPAQVSERISADRDKGLWN